MTEQPRLRVSFVYFHAADPATRCMLKVTFHDKVLMDQLRAVTGALHGGRVSPLALSHPCVNDILAFDARGVPLRMSVAARALPSLADEVSAAPGGRLSDLDALLVLLDVYAGLEFLSERGLLHWGLSLASLGRDGDRVVVGDLHWAEANPQATLDADGVLKHDIVARARRIPALTLPATAGLLDFSNGLPNMSKFNCALAAPIVWGLVGATVPDHDYARRLDLDALTAIPGVGDRVCGFRWMWTYGWRCGWCSLGTLHRTQAGFLSSSSL